MITELGISKDSKCQYRSAGSSFSDIWKWKLQIPQRGVHGIQSGLPPKKEKNYHKLIEKIPKNSQKKIFQNSRKTPKNQKKYTVQM